MGRLGCRGFGGNDRSQGSRWDRARPRRNAWRCGSTRGGLGGLQTQDPAPQRPSRSRPPAHIGEAPTALDKWSGSVSVDRLGNRAYGRGLREAAGGCLPAARWRGRPIRFRSSRIARFERCGDIGGGRRDIGRWGRRIDDPLPEPGEIVRRQRALAGRRQPELRSQLCRQRIGAGVRGCDRALLLDREVEVGRCRIGHGDEIDHQPFPAGKPMAMVEPEVGSELDSFSQEMQPRRIGAAHVERDADDRDRLTEELGAPMDRQHPAGGGVGENSGRGGGHERGTELFASPTCLLGIPQFLRFLSCATRLARRGLIGGPCGCRRLRGGVGAESRWERANGVGRDRCRGSGRCL